MLFGSGLSSEKALALSFPGIGQSVGNTGTEVLGRSRRDPVPEDYMLKISTSRARALLLISTLSLRT